MIKLWKLLKIEYLIDLSKLTYITTVFILNKMFLVYDLETTGLPMFNTKGKYRFFNFRWLNKYDSSRIVSISWILFDNFGKILKQEYHIMRPLDFDIDNTSKAVEIHGITQEIAQEKGVTWHYVYDKFFHDLKKSHSIVAHNLQFDFSVMLSEMHRYGKQEGIDEMFEKRRLCTLQLGRVAMKQTKAPKLSELYKFLHNEELTNAHDALHDTLHCCKCMLAMMHFEDVQKYISEKCKLLSKE